ncbi:MAG: hypothetical protein C4551_01960 [Bacillota bacterium]|nr:MAG: hypothetical protein C4551_01960 [Bacillota bacterium]
MMREYRTEDIIVYWKPELCTHVRSCVDSPQGLPIRPASLGRPRRLRRPWGCC